VAATCKSHVSDEVAMAVVVVLKSEVDHQAGEVAPIAARAVDSRSSVCVI
jgi:hypothetical protein